jgi:hypothetical protein
MVDLLVGIFLAYPHDPVQGRRLILKNKKQNLSDSDNMKYAAFST